MHKTQPHQHVLVTFQREGRLPWENEPTVFPAGTQLIGEWSPEQPGGERTYHIETAAMEWELEADEVTIQSPLPALPPVRQEDLARVHEQAGKHAEQQGERGRAATLYSSAIAEYAMAGWSEVNLAIPRMTRGGVLVRLGRYGEASQELDRAARACEEAAHDPEQRLFHATGYLDYAECAAAALRGLGSAYLLQQAEPPKIRQVIERLKGINALIKKRYETKVEVLLELAALSLEISEQKDAADFLAQADRFYSQQLALYPRGGRIDWITKRLGELKPLIQPGATQTIAFTITANTPDEIKAILAVLEQQHIPSLEVTRGVSTTASGTARSGVRYSARLRITLPGKKKSQ